MLGNNSSGNTNLALAVFGCLWESLIVFANDWVHLGNVTGYPGVFPCNPHPYPSKPVPTSTGAGFDKYGCGFCKNPRGYNPSMGAPSNTDRENIS